VSRYHFVQGFTSILKKVSNSTLALELSILGNGTNIIKVAKLSRDHYVLVILLRLYSLWRGENVTQGELGGLKIVRLVKVNFMQAKVPPPT
jgi:hypothetical protein